MPPPIDDSDFGNIVTLRPKTSPKHITTPIIEWVASSVSYTLEKRRFPLDREKLKNSSERVRDFFSVMKLAEYVALHMSTDTLDDESFFICWLPDREDIVHIDLREFCVVMKWAKKLLKIPSDALEEIIDDMFHEAKIPLDMVLFSPRSFRNNQTSYQRNSGTEWDMWDRLSDRVFQKWEYFYTVETTGDDIPPLRVSPESIIDSAHDSDVMLLIAQYLEQVYKGYLEVYSHDTMVSLHQYLYQKGETITHTCTMRELEWVFFTEIRDQYPLFREMTDLENILTKYLERRMSWLQEGKVHSLRKSELISIVPRDR